LAGAVGVHVPGDEDTWPNRLSGLGALLGIVTGVGVGALIGTLRYAGVRLPAPLAAVAAGAAAMGASDGSTTTLGVTDPRQWDADSWLSDTLSRLAYGAVTIAVPWLFQAIRRRED
jgi:hypothetical protein